MKPMEKTVKGQRNNTVSEDDNKIDNLSDVEKHEIAKRFDEYIKKELKEFAENYIAEKYKKDK